MIGYVTIGAMDVETSGVFYDAVLTKIGQARKYTRSDWIGYGPADEGPDSVDCHICQPYNGKPARAGNGIMLAFRAGSKEEVDNAYTSGLATGGKDEGMPGPRTDHFYGAYLRDPTGNKLCIYFKS